VGAAKTTELAIELPDCVLVLNDLGEVLWGNKAAERLFGRSSKDSIGFRALELVHPDDLELVLRSLESVQRKELGTLIEVRAKTASGWRLLEVLGTPIEWPDQTTAILFCMRDLTERRRFEVAHNKDAMFRTVVQNSPAMTMLLSQSGVVVSVSGALSRVLGHDPEFIEGHELVAFVVEEDQPQLLASLLRASLHTSTFDPLRLRVRLTRRDEGEAVPFELTFANLLDDPIVGGFIVSAHDISSQVIAERRLHQSEQRFRRIFSQGPVGIVLTDFEQCIAETNDCFCRFVGQPSEKVIGSMFESFVNPDDRDQLRALCLELTQHPTLTYKKVTRLRSQGNDVIVASLTASVIQDESNEPIHWLWIVEDITERIDLERELASHAKTAGQLLARLTKRETEVLDLLEDSVTAPDIARRLTLSVRTVETHLTNAYRKLGVHSRSAAMAEYARLTRTATTELTRVGRPLAQ
jgi:PAS domain S-box-containing protein